MLSLTAIILTKNEEKNISKCIKSVSNIAERVVIIDSYSEDRTVQVSESLGADVYQHKFISHSEQFNWALDNIPISSKWILRIDADEELTSELINELKDKLPNIKDEVTGRFRREEDIF